MYIKKELPTRLFVAAYSSFIVSICFNPGLKHGSHRTSAMDNMTDSDGCLVEHGDLEVNSP